MADLVASQVGRARQALALLTDSDFKDSLHRLADDLAVAASHLLVEPRKQDVAP